MMKKKPVWTQADIDFLYEKYGLLSDKFIAERLDRSIGAIRQKALALGICRTQHFLTANQVALIFGVGQATVTKRWIAGNFLKARRSGVVRSGLYKVWIITQSNLEEFMREHPAQYNPDRINRELYPYHRGLADRYTPKNHVPIQPGYWSEREDAFLLHHRRQLTYREIAARLNRTPEAVHARLALLRAKGRLAPYARPWKSRLERKSFTNMRPWSEEEDRYLYENWGRPRRLDESGRRSYITCKEVAEHLKRTETACWSRASRLGIAGRTPYSPRRKTG